MKRHRPIDDDDGHTSSKIQKRDSIVLEDEMFVYELKCVHHSKLNDSHSPPFTSLLLFTKHEWENLLAFSLFEREVVQRTNTQMFVSPVFLFKVDTDDSKMNLLINWAHTVLGKERGYSIVSDSDADFFMTPMKNIDSWLKLIRKHPLNVTGNYDFQVIYNGFLEVLGDADLLEIDSNPGTVQTHIVSQCSQMNCDLESLKSNLLERFNSLRHNNQTVEFDNLIHSDSTISRFIATYRRISDKFKGMVVSRKSDQLLFKVDYVDLLSDQDKILIACTPIVDRYEMSDDLDTFRSHIEHLIGKVERTESVFISGDDLAFVPFSRGIIYMIRYKQNIQQFFEKVKRHSANVREKLALFGFTEQDMRYLFTCTVDESFANFHGNRLHSNSNLAFLGHYVLQLFSMEFFHSRNNATSGSQLQAQVDHLLSQASMSQIAVGLGLRDCILSETPISDQSISLVLKAIIGAKILRHRIDLVKKFCCTHIFKMNYTNILSAGFSDPMTTKAVENLEITLHIKFNVRSIVGSTLFGIDTMAIQQRDWFLMIGKQVVHLVAAHHLFFKQLHRLDGSLFEDIQTLFNDNRIAEASNLLPNSIKTQVPQNNLFLCLIGLVYCDSGLHVHHGGQFDVTNMLVHKYLIYNMNTTVKSTTQDSFLSASSVRQIIDRQRKAIQTSDTLRDSKLLELQKQVFSARQTMELQETETNALKKVNLLLLQIKNLPQVPVHLLFRSTSEIHAYLEREYLNMKQRMSQNSLEDPINIDSDEEL